MKPIIPILVIALSLTAGAAEKLLPFQGYLADAAGTAIDGEAKVVQFRIYDAPVSGAAVWAGEVHKLSVNAGLVNTILGTRTSLAGVDFAKTRYLEITVDADGDDAITASDPPLLPRQVILPSVFAAEAADARLLDGNDWSAVFIGGDPINGKLKPSIIQAGSIPAAAIVANNALIAAHLADRSVGAAEIDVNAVGSSEIDNGSIRLSDLSNSLLKILNPPGTVVAFAGTAAPWGWSICDGRAVSRTGYFSDLFGTIGTTHGVGNGSTTFNLPDYRGRFLRGVDGIAGRDPDKNSRTAMALAGNTGNSVGSVQPDQVRAHNHAYTAYTIASNSGSRIDVFESGSNDAIYQNPAYLVTNNTGAAETRPENAYVNYIIKH